jgi:hypothetical protein
MILDVRADTGTGPTSHGGSVTDTVRRSCTHTGGTHTGRTSRTSPDVPITRLS